MKYIKQNDSPYFVESKTLVEGLGFKLVDYVVNRQKSGWKIDVVIFSKDGVGIDDCSKVHRPLQQRLEVLLDSQDVSMEVSSPGVKRIIKKSYELEAFINEFVSIWDLSCTNWITGKLLGITDNGIKLDTEKGLVEISYDNVKKAKLE